MKNKIIVLVLLICIMCPQIVVYASSHGGSSGSFGDNEHSGWYGYSGNLTNGIDGIYSVNSSGDLNFYEISYYNSYCYDIEFMKAYILEKSNHGECENFVYVGYKGTNDLGNTSRFVFFVPDDVDLPLSDIIVCPKADTFNQGNYMEFYDRNSGNVIKGSLFSFGNSAIEVSGNAQITMNYERGNYVNFFTFASNYFINCPVEMLESNVKIYGYGSDSQLTSSQCRDILNNAITGELKADNEDDFLPKRYGVLEVPQNIRSTGGIPSGWKSVLQNIFGDDNITIKWTQTDPNYTNWTTEILIYGDMGVKWIYEVFSDTKRVDNLFLYSENFSTNKLKFTIDMDKMIMNNPIWQTKIVEILDSSSGGFYHNCYGLSLFIRNKYSDGIYNYYSNWVELKFDDEGMSGGVNNDGSNTEYDYDDPVKGDEGTDFTQNKPTGSVNPDSPYQGDKINPSTDFSISDFLNNGFGLAGDGGLVDMFRELFSFIPVPVWTLILTGLSILIAIALLKAVF